ncbi:hypothetical protein Mal4_33130 [Maioricimonas rarisocia]|uniref:Carboxypeptidase regulatory-like domain-containing protein n=1 Tax=Maioricimonas rarisocia TaxID=2528026 RepID=A0A517Z968_9PLAN|nr:carboxypeptidase-like regulatory domain-containing protein [Maioricimonas rarisocia]QDU38981.1 hypothetical protein Mal4_33130 [Maioricimonas rarisocia]
MRGDCGKAWSHIGAMVLCASLSAGCGGGNDGPELIDVYGTVTMDGQPLEGATVQFAPEGGAGEGRRLVAGRTDSSGEYSLQYSPSRDGAAPGSYRVSITTYREMEVDEEGMDVPGSPETVPDVYNVNTTLAADVSSDNAEHNFELDSSEGEVIGGQGGEDFGDDDEAE